MSKAKTGRVPDNRSRILSITARNIKRIREVCIDDMGDIVEIRGDADQGKTSILDAIEGSLTGIDKSMVRRGADKAELELVLSDATIKRIIGAEDGKEILMVTDAAGKAVDRGKDFLKTICGSAAFRPLAWVQLSGGAGKGATERRRMQRDQLLESLNVSLGADKVVDIIERQLGQDHVDAMDQINIDGVDFDQHPFVVCRALLGAAKEHYKVKHAEQERAEEAQRHTPAPAIAAPKQDAETLRAEAREATRKYHEANARAADAQSLVARRDALAKGVAESAETLPDAGKVQAAREKYGAQETELIEKIEALEAELEAARESLGKARAALEKCAQAEQRIKRHQADELELADAEARLANQQVLDVDALREAEAKALERLEARELQDKHDAASAIAQEAAEVAKRYKALVELFRDGIPKQLLAEADLPVSGLSVDDDQILIDGVPLHQLGTSRQIKLGVLIAHALNPRSGFVLVDGAESMGSADRIALAETAAELGLQLIMTFVDPDAVPGEGVTVMREGLAV